MTGRQFCIVVLVLGFVSIARDVCLGQNRPKDAANASEEQRLYEWPQLKGNSGFTGLSPDDSVKPPLKLVWSYRLDGDASGDAGAGVIVAGGKVFVPVANSHSIVALDAESGRFCWEHRDESIGQIGYLGHAPVPAYHKGRVILWQRRKSSGVMALDAETGAVQWQQPLSPHGMDLSRGGLPVADGMVYCSEGGPDPAISALDIETGKRVWRTALGSDVGVYAIGRGRTSGPAGHLGPRRHRSGGLRGCVRNDREEARPETRPSGLELLVPNGSVGF